MRTPAEAIEEILDRMQPAAHRESVALRQAGGRILAENAISDVNLPPFEKSAMDGFAVRGSDFEGQGDSELELMVLGESAAGAPFSEPVPPGSCVAIYTGAELPEQTDTVVMVESSTRDGQKVRLKGPVATGQHVNHRAEILAEGRLAVAAPKRLDAADLQLLAAVGLDPTPVLSRLRLSILTTGDELVPPHTKPGPGQIREGNTLFLAAACERWGHEVVRVGVLPDKSSELEAGFAAALEDSDALITTGGVSMGAYDLVGQAFEALGVEPILHKVAIKPGKPIWFGMHGKKPVFGLPGNPLSSLLGFEVFVRPALAKMAGAPQAEQRERLQLGVWCGSAVAPHGRQQNLPVRIERDELGRARLIPQAWMGSADVLSVSLADAFAVIPAGEAAEPGAMLNFRPLN